MPNVSKLQAIAVALARGDSAATIAKEQGVHPRTVQRWAATPECKQQVDAIRNDMLSEAVAKLKGLASKAVDTLGELMDVDSPAIRLQASRTVLGSLVEIQNHVELIGRFE